MLVDNHGYASIGALSRSVGSAGFGTHYRARANGAPAARRADGTRSRSRRALPVDLAANAESLGARVIRARTIAELRAALDDARGADGPVVVHIETDRYAGVPSYDGWWDVPVAEVSDDDAVRAAREAYERARRAQRTLDAVRSTPMSAAPPPACSTTTSAARWTPATSTDGARRDQPRDRRGARARAAVVAADLDAAVARRARGAGRVARGQHDRAARASCSSCASGSSRVRRTSRAR